MPTVTYSAKNKYTERKQNGIIHHSHSQAVKGFQKKREKEIRHSQIYSLRFGV